MIIEDSGEAEVKVKEKAKKAVEKREVSIDVKFDDVIKWQKEGYDLIFSWDKPIELDSEQFKQLSVKHKDRYYQAKEAAKGTDLVDVSVKAQKAYKDDYVVRPGSPTEKTTVLNKEEGFEYRWVLPQRVSMKEAQGWVIDHGKAKKQVNNTGEDVKTIGTRDKAELVLMKIEKKVVEEREKKNREKYARTKEYTLESFERTAKNLGSKVIN